MVIYLEDYKYVSSAKSNLETYSENTFVRLVLLFHIEVISNKALSRLAFQQKPGFVLSLIFCQNRSFCSYKIVLIKKSVYKKTVQYRCFPVNFVIHLFCRKTPAGCLFLIKTNFLKTAIYL